MNRGPGSHPVKTHFIQLVIRVKFISFAWSWLWCHISIVSPQIIGNSIVCWTVCSDWHQRDIKAAHYTEGCWNPLLRKARNRFVGQTISNASSNLGTVLEWELFSQFPEFHYFYSFFRNYQNTVHYPVHIEKVSPQLSFHKALFMSISEKHTDGS